MVYSGAGVRVDTVSQDLEVIDPPVKRRRSASQIHQAIADLRLANPEMSQGDIAQRLGYTQTWVSMVECSDSFKAYFAGRRAEFEKGIVEDMRDTIRSRANRILARAHQIIEDSLNRGDVGFNTAVRAGDHIAKFADAEQAESARSVEQHLHIHGENLRQLLRRRKAEAAIDVTPVALPTVADVVTPQASTQAGDGDHS